MQIIYTNEEMPATITKSIFLAGPTPRNKQEVSSWRPDALKLLDDMGYDGIVFVPEDHDGQFKMDYDDQIGWEEKYLNLADCIVFWIPRDLSLDSDNNIKLPAFTTNIEWGAWADSGKVVVGAPEDAEKIAYIKHYAEEYKVPFSDTLTGTLKDAMDKLGEGAERSGGERYVPLFVWNLDSFQSWYQAQTNAGNTLEYARLLYTFRPRFKDFVFLWILKAKIYVTSEDRFKENEIVISRPDISSVCLYHYPTDGDSTFDHQIVIVKEFRTPSSSKDGFVRELPGGSAIGKSSPEEIAAEEVSEETGFYLNSSRLKSHGVRQLSGTFSAHKAHLYSAELTDEEIKWFESQKDIVHGKVEDTERTFIEVYNVHDLVNKELVDWTTLGQILSVIVPSSY